MDLDHRGDAREVKGAILFLAVIVNVLCKDSHTAAVFLGGKENAIHRNDLEGADSIVRDGAVVAVEVAHNAPDKRGNNLDIIGGELNRGERGHGIVGVAGERVSGKRIWRKLFFTENRDFPF